MKKREVAVAELWEAIIDRVERLDEEMTSPRRSPAKIEAVAAEIASLAGAARILGARPGR